LYRFFLEIRPMDVLDMLSEEGCKRILNLDLEDVVTAEPEKRDARIWITKKGGAWIVSYDIAGIQSDAKEAYIGPSDLKELYEDQGIIDKVKEVTENAVWKQLDDKLQIPNATELVAEVRACTQTLMSVGSSLYEAFYRDKVFQAVLDEVEKLP